ncbi:MAG: hypothetical protein KF823_12760 [Xanthomonadales bacterium]|nr:hypothetical protein [Xanthomonadales bacterium]
MLLGLVLLPGWAGADVFTVGAGGSHASIQSAINAALALNGGNHEIRIRQGVYFERPVVTLPLGTIELSGGWHPGFAQRTVDPANTQLVALAAGRALEAVLSGSSRLTVSGMSITGGFLEDATGAGVGLLAQQTASAEFLDVRVALNQVRLTGGSGTNAGVGFFAALVENARLTIERAHFEENNVTADSQPAHGAVYLSLRFGSRVDLRDSVFARNRVAPGGANRTLALQAYALNARLGIEGNRFEDNVDATSQQTVVDLQVHGNSEIAFERNRLSDNGQALQLRAVVSDVQSVPMRIVGNLITGGGTGLVVAGAGATPPRVGWNTITGHSGFGIGPSSFIHWHNNIIVRNGTDAAPTPPFPDTNLTDIDPGFVAYSRGDHRLRSGSLGHDAGTPIIGWAAPTIDLDGVPRASGLEVDIGAFEHDEDRLLFAGFED